MLHLDGGYSSSNSNLEGEGGPQHVVNREGGRDQIRLKTG